MSRFAVSAIEAESKESPSHGKAAVSLLYRVMLLVVAALLPLAGAEFYNQMRMRADREAELHREATQLLSLIEDEQGRIIDGIAQLIGTLSETPLVQGENWTQCRDFFTRIRDKIPAFIDVGIIDEEGWIRCSTNPPVIGINVQDRDYYKLAIASPKTLVLGEHLWRASTGRPVLPLAFGFTNAAGKPGVANATLDLDWLDDYLARKPLPPGANVILADRSGIVLAHTPRNTAIVNQPLAPPYSALLRASAAAGTTVLTESDGRQRIIAYSQAGHGSPGLFSAIGLDGDNAMRPIDDATRRALTLMVSVLVVAVAGAWVGGHWMLRRPVGALLGATERWRQGDYGARVGFRGGSEIGALAAAFDSMADAVQSQARAREEASAMAHRMAAVLSSITDSVLEVDGHFRVTFINDRARRMLAAPPEAVGRVLWDLIPDAVQTPLWHHCHDVLQSHIPVDFEQPCAHPGTWCWFRLFPSSDGLTLYFQDVTERRTQQRDYRRTAARLRAVVNTAVDAIILVDENCHIQSFNPAAEHIFGWREAEVVGRPLSDLIPSGNGTTLDGNGDGERHDDASNCLNALAGPETSGREGLGRTQSGAVFPVEMSVAEWQDEGRPAFTVILRDITRRKLLDAALVRAKEEAERASLAKSKFLAAASHDLRQPVQSLFLFAAGLDRHVIEPRGREKLAHLQVSLEALKDLLDGLLDMSRLDAGLIRATPEAFPVSDILTQVDSAYAPVAAARGIAWSVVPCADMIVSDRTLLGHMLRNLVENAIRYTPSGSVRVTCHSGGSRIQIDVADTGVGIAQEHLEEIFEEFHQLGNPERDRRQGLGLGLAIVRRLSELLHHPVEVRSTVGQGTTFSIIVPLAAAGDP